MAAKPLNFIGMSTAQGTCASPEPRLRTSAHQATPEHFEMAPKSAAPHAIPAQIGRKAYYNPNDDIVALPGLWVMNALDQATMTLIHAEQGVLNTYDAGVKMGKTAVKVATLVIRSSLIFAAYAQCGPACSVPPSPPPPSFIQKQNRKDNGT